MSSVPFGVLSSFNSHQEREHIWGWASMSHKSDLDNETISPWEANRLNKKHSNYLSLLMSPASYSCRIATQDLFSFSLFHLSQFLQSLHLVLWFQMPSTCWQLTTCISLVLTTSGTSHLIELSIWHFYIDEQLTFQT